MLSLVKYNAKCSSLVKYNAKVDKLTCFRILDYSRGKS
jgi:hypothetical protein